MLDADTPLRHDILMMTEFRLIDNKQEIKNAIRIEIPQNRIIDGAGFIPTQAPPKEDEVYHVVDDMPEFPGGSAELLKYLSTHIKYPTMSQEMAHKDV